MKNIELYIFYLGTQFCLYTKSIEVGKHMYFWRIIEAQKKHFIHYSAAGEKLTLMITIQYIFILTDDELKFCTFPRIGELVSCYFQGSRKGTVEDLMSCQVTAVLGR